jgi:osmotically inducible protein OsmC
MAISGASGNWDGTFENGCGDMKPEHGPDLPFSKASRFEGASGANPEELIAAAFAGCFSMALAARLERAGMTPEHVRTRARVHLDQQNGSFEIHRIELENVTKASGGDEEMLRLIGEETKHECPVGKLLDATITLDAKLVR